MKNMFKIRFGQKLIKGTGNDGGGPLIHGGIINPVQNAIIYGINMIINCLSQKFKELIYFLKFTNDEMDYNNLYFFVLHIMIIYIYKYQYLNISNSKQNSIHLRF